MNPEKIEKIKRLALAWAEACIAYDSAKAESDAAYAARKAREARKAHDAAPLTAYEAAKAEHDAWEKRNHARYVRDDAWEALKEAFEELGN
jgi:hypothetical protein